MIRVLVADAHPLLRAGLKQVLAETTDLAVTDEAASGQEVLAKIRRQAFDVVSLDLAMPDGNGLEVLKQIKAEQPDLPVLVLSMYPEDQFALRAIKAGAAGYLAKTSIPGELVAALRKIAAGGRYISASLAEQLALSLQHPDQARMPHEQLSDREYEIFCRIGRGETVSQIAAQLHLSVKTVSTHRAHILKKMRLASNAQLMRYALDQKLVD